MNRFAKTATILAAGVFGLAACTNSAAPQEGEPGGSSEGTDAGAYACPAGTLSAEGSSAQQVAFESTMAAYGEVCGNKATINYNPTGSGNGIKAFNGGLVDFAGSDSALKDEAKEGESTSEVEAAKTNCGSDAWNLPMVVGPIAVAFNVEGVDNLALTPSLISQIFDGKITKWNDPKIAEANSGVTLPDAEIATFFRSDESGTTENFQKFLSKTAEKDWTYEPSKTWPTKAGEGKAKSAGVAEAVSSTPNSISYMEWGYAKDNNLAIAALDTGSGPAELNAESVGKAVNDAEVKGEGNDLALELKYSDLSEGAYPMILVTYEIVCAENKDAEKGALIKDYLTYMVGEENQAALEEQGFAPLPTELRTKVAASIDALK
ncbi:phosphate ABC transporter substrate-binding protein PstS [Propionibacteriaceae bacterium Y1700]|uniref:phosphate ABC transporter substrate-binding protein PstS n=1 Tax=Microlunatus sp. Y1700 TaxID=3418487 RepID=UPI003DA747A4